MPAAAQPKAPCDVSFSSSSANQMGVISDTLRENYFMIALAFFILGLGAFLVWMLIRNIMSTVGTYKRFTRRPEPIVEVNPLAEKAPGQLQRELDALMSGEASGDDYAYVPVRESELLGGEPIPERESINKRITELKNIYADYNEEITKHSRDVLKKEPEDLVDERIIAQEDDIY
jgi:hypothetical protein